ncbi:urease accessory protein UreE [Novosphingobium sp. PY1]|uniref:Urease accessory protein UreE n=1 Tax=Ochrobactrum sp. PW1 TaxID=1882222 RepID=A0A292GT12_9HYPH|nr:urease accessory protein UreE [Novosphingobium sp. PY1]BBA74361.1 urease accessory protein [Ochrobactrum sp. PW1]GFM29210.1 urease accessory protein [Novosphingobium sp. PY1]
MRRIIRIESEAVEKAADAVRLDFDQRNRRRIVFTTNGGASILLDMARPVHLRDGDMLRLDDDSMVRVEALCEPLIEIAAHSSAELVRISWHLGNRHLPTQLLPGDSGGTLRIRHDHVIAEMVVGLGGHCQPVLAPFDPEGGAYSGTGGHHHGHGHDHEHEHEHEHGQAHNHAHSHGQEHHAHG